MLIGGLGVYLRAVPEALWEWFVCQTTMMITVKDDDAAFVWVKEWLLEQNFLKHLRRVDLDTTLRGKVLALIPAPGRHWFWHGGRPFTVWFYRSDETRGRSLTRDESLTFRTIGRNQKVLRRFVDEVIASHQRSLKFESSLFVYADDYWTRVEGYVPRSLDSVILPPGEKDQLLQDVESFKASGKRYRDLGVPYHRGYLLHGPPGTGKTSLVSALARRFGMSIYSINLTEFNDRSLINAIHEVPQGSMVLFEDIDCMAAGKTRMAAGDVSSLAAVANGGGRNDVLDMMGVTLSGLLNVLDGFSAPDDVLFAMTTNHFEVLDHALLRPGRIDYRLYLGAADDRQKVELYRRFFPTASELDAVDFVESNRSAATMAEFQGLLLGFQEDLPTSNMVPTSEMADEGNSRRA